MDGARWYDPSAASFRSRDTVFGELHTPFSLNRYTYAFGNPMSYWDPDGRMGIGIDGWANAETAIKNGFKSRKTMSKARQEQLTRPRGTTPEPPAPSPAPPHDMGSKYTPTPRPQTSVVETIRAAGVVLHQEGVVLHPCATTTSCGADEHLVAVTDIDVSNGHWSEPWLVQHFGLGNGVTIASVDFEQRDTPVSVAFNIGGGGTDADDALEKMLAGCAAYGGEALECIAADAILAGAPIDHVDDWLGNACTVPAPTNCYRNSGGATDWTDEFLAYAEAPFIVSGLVRAGLRAGVKELAEEGSESAAQRGAVMSGGAGTPAVSNHPRGSVQIGRDSHTVQFATRADIPDGTLGVAVHGTPDGWALGVTTDDVVGAITSHPNYSPGQCVTLFSCYAGANGTAADLAQEMGSGVVAPTTRVHLDPGSSAPYLDDGGVWKFFE